MFSFTHNYNIKVKKSVEFMVWFKKTRRALLYINQIPEIGKLLNLCYVTPKTNESLLFF